MNTNSYGWIILYIVVVAMIGLFGAHFGYTVDGLPVKNNNALDFLGSLLLFKIDNMPSVFNWVFIASPFMVAWIVYRQVRGQD